jgi:hypothetical protein
MIIEHIPRGCTLVDDARDGDDDTRATAVTPARRHASPHRGFSLKHPVARQTPVAHP